MASSSFCSRSVRNARGLRFSLSGHRRRRTIYGIDDIDLMRRAASWVDRILKGEKVVNLPVQAAVKFDLVLKLSAAKVLGQ
jgi:putative tryptophan/tyrosine transport system substrate-binding protein